MTGLRRLLPDRFVTSLLATVVVASLIPARGVALELVGGVSTAAIVALFFFHGLRLEREAVVAGIVRWRLHAAILAFTFGAMPLIGIALSLAGAPLLPPELWLGILFLGALPTTVQSSIAYSSMSGGNVAAAVVAAAASSILAVVLTPLIFALIAHRAGGIGDPHAILRIATMLLLPFMLGQFARRWLTAWAARHKSAVGMLDRVTILLAVYVAFSEAVTGGLWATLDGTTLAWVMIAVSVLLALAFAGSLGLGRLLGFDPADQRTLMFCGAHKSLATGAPMIRILFPGAESGAILLPLIIYHQLQLMVSAVVAKRMAPAAEAATPAAEPQA